MAEFALGLTKTVVDGTLSRVKSAIEEEARLKEKVQHDLVFITGEFQMMQSFLNVANKERAQNQVVRTWVRQLRDLAFDVEDCVEFVVHLDNKPAWWWRVVPSCAAPPRHRRLDEAVAEIKQLKARVEDVSQRNTRYNLISDSTSRSITVAEEEHTTTASRPSAFPILRQVWGSAGRMQRYIENLQDVFHRGSSDLQVISIWGSAGGDVGATTMLRKAYYDRNVCQEFKIRLWIKPMHPFNRDEFLDSLVVQLCTSSQHAALGMDFQKGMKATMATEDNLTRAEQLMKENKYLVVLEEVSTLLEWDTIKMLLPDGKNGSRVVMATQDLGVALMCTGEPYEVAELTQFSHGQSLCAFYKTVSSSRYRGIHEIKRLITRRGVISLHGRTMSKVLVIKNHIKRDREYYRYVGFRTYSWVNVSSPLNKVDFARRLLVDLDNGHTYGSSADLQENEVAAVDQDDSGDLQANQDDPGDLQANEVAGVDLDSIKGCCEILREKNYLLVIDGLQSTEDWDWIKSTFLSQPIKGCIIVVTNEERVAKHCVEDEEDRAVNCTYLQAKSPRINEAYNWKNNFDLVECKIAEEFFKYSRVYSVWGIAGTRKSDLVRKFYYDRLVCTPDLPTEQGVRKYYSWVDVHHPLNLFEFCLHLLLDFYSDDLQAKEAAAVSIIEGQDPIQGCRNILRNYSCFVVVDGLRTKDEWDLIKGVLLTGINIVRGTVVVITNEATLANYCVHYDDKCVANVKCLEADDAFYLFTNITFSSVIPTRRDMELSEQILAKCGGLSEVITAIGIYCCAHPAYYLIKINENFMEMLEKNVKYFDCLKGLFSWMQSYFEDCKDSLKPCIFYLPVFPTNHNFKRRRLLRRWIAEGYSRDTSSGTAEENGERMFSELVDLSIIQHPSSKSPCRVNGFFHEYITSRPMEDNLVFALEGHCSLNSQLVGKHLTIRKSWDRDINVFESIDFSSLRSLTVFGEWRPFFMSSSINMRLLRVLDLEDTSNLTDDDLEQIGKLLPRLKFLSLRGRRGITRLPNSFGGLGQLQTLDVRHTSIATLPQAIIKLLKLQYIRAGTSKEPWDEGGRITIIPTRGVNRASTPADDGTHRSQQVAPTQAEEGASTSSTLPASSGVVQASMQSRIRPHTMVSSWLSKMWGKPQHHNNRGVEVPAGIGKMTALHTLGIVNVSGAHGKAILMELQTLSRLRRLGLCGINRENLNELCCAISGHGHLETLSVQVDEEKEQGLICSFDDTIAPPPNNLKSLKLYGCVHILPGSSWIIQLGNLKMLDLEMTVFREQDMYVLDELENTNALRRLCVKFTRGGEIHFKAPKNLWYPNLEVLEIDCTSKLQVTFSPEHRFTNSVEVVKVHCSSGSSLRISGIETLLKLKSVWLKGSYGDELKEDLQQQLSRHGNKPVLNLVQPCMS